MDNERELLESIIDLLMRQRLVTLHQRSGPRNVRVDDDRQLPGNLWIGHIAPPAVGWAEHYAPDLRAIEPLDGLEARGQIARISEFSGDFCIMDRPRYGAP